MSSFDARVRYTRRVIEESFLELLKQKPAARVTVTEVCARAQINRATFYKHYLDIPDLLDQIEQALFAQIRGAFRAEQIEVKTFLLEMLRYTYRERERFFALGGENGDPNLMTKTYLVCYESAYPLLSSNLPGLSDPERQMLYQFLSQGAGGVLTWWVRSGMQLPPEQLAQFILSLSAIAADGVLQPNWREVYQGN